MEKGSPAILGVHWGDTRLRHKNIWMLFESLITKIEFGMGLSVGQDPDPQKDIRN